jgi:predicted flap endonuclease-1-like 5' DNA nuclease
VNVRQKLTEMESTSAFVVGGGLVLLILGFALASSQSGMSGFEPSRLNIVMIVGGLLFVAGIAMWIGTAQPWKNFDDWSKPLYTGHHDQHTEHHTERAPHVHDQDVTELGVEPVEPHPITLQEFGPSTDLVVIEGIGPRIAASLKAVGIENVADLLTREPLELERIVRDAGVRMVGHSDTWIEQAKILINGTPEEFEAYKRQLKNKPRK